MTPLVSIIVPTYNRAGLLGECLASLERLDYPVARFECIVVDDGSRDATPAALAAFTATTRLQFTYLSQPNRGPAAARNAGLRRARGTYVTFTDDDCTADPHWLEALLAPFAAAEAPPPDPIQAAPRPQHSTLNTQNSSPVVGGVGGSVRTRSRGLISDYMAFYHIVDHHLDDGGGMPAFLITANACYRRALLCDLGGFDEHFARPGFEDVDLAWRVTARGYALRFSPAAVVYHQQKTRLAGFLRTFYAYGQGQRYVLAKHGRLPAGAAAPAHLPGYPQVFSPIRFGSRLKYHARTRRLGWRAGLAWAGLDHLRELLFLRGYRRLD